MLSACPASTERLRDIFDVLILLVLANAEPRGVVTGDSLGRVGPDFDAR